MKPLKIYNYAEKKRAVLVVIVYYAITLTSLKFTIFEASNFIILLKADVTNKEKPSASARSHSSNLLIIRLPHHMINKSLPYESHRMSHTPLYSINGTTLYKRSIILCSVRLETRQRQCVWWATLPYIPPYCNWKKNNWILDKYCNIQFIQQY